MFWLQFFSSDLCVTKWAGFIYKFISVYSKSSFKKLKTKKTNKFTSFSLEVQLLSLASDWLDGSVTVVKLSQSDMPNDVS